MRISDWSSDVCSSDLLNDPSSTGGGFNFANLLAGDIDRIEVLRGPQSILWGSQAIGGVINIVTAAPEKALEGSFDLEAGSRETVRSEEHTSELQSLMRISYAVVCLEKKNENIYTSQFSTND